MKKLLLILSVIFGTTSFQIESCPTCQSKIKEESAPFFTDDFYKPTAESMDYIYQQLLEEESSHEKEERA